MAYEQDFRQLSAQYLAQGQWDMAYRTLVDLWNHQPSLATAHYLLASYERLRQHALDPLPARSPALVHGGAAGAAVASCGLRPRHCSGGARGSL